MNENNVMPLESANVSVPVYEYADVVAVPRSEYNDLITARRGIDMIGNSLNKYGVDDNVAKAVCKLFGYEYKEDEADA